MPGNGRQQLQRQSQQQRASTAIAVAKAVEPVVGKKTAVNSCTPSKSIRFKATGIVASAVQTTRSKSRINRLLTAASTTSGRKTAAAVPATSSSLVAASKSMPSVVFSSSAGRNRNETCLGLLLPMSRIDGKREAGKVKKFVRHAKSQMKILKTCKKAEGKRTDDKAAVLWTIKWEAVGICVNRSTKMTRNFTRLSKLLVYNQNWNINVICFPKLRPL